MTAPLPETASLEDRTRRILADFAREEKGYPFNYAGDGTAYAVQMAALLEKWMAGAAVPDDDRRRAQAGWAAFREAVKACDADATPWLDLPELARNGLTAFAASVRRALRPE